ncbi:MAG: hypothetical protein V4732_20805 [Pseudomonadota bacterium]
MKNIDEVCKTLLDNANVRVDLSKYPNVVLTFIVAGLVKASCWEVIFQLNSVTNLSVLREHEEDYSPLDEYLVLAVSVVEHKVGEVKFFSINVGHGDEFNFSANCVEFYWSAVEYTESEFKEKFSYI